MEDETKQIATSEWITSSGRCKMTIEVSNELTHGYVYEQWKGLMEALGYCMEEYGENMD